MPPWELEALIAKKKAETLEALKERETIKELEPEPTYGYGRDGFGGTSYGQTGCKFDIEKMAGKINELVDKVNKLTAIVEGKK